VFLVLVIVHRTSAPGATLTSQPPVVAFAVAVTAAFEAAWFTHAIVCA
jgi:hypothetical protein